MTKLKISLFSALCLPLTLFAAGSLEPGVACRVDSKLKAPVKFMDVSGRVLYFGTYPEDAELVFPPPGAVRSSREVSPYPRDTDLSLPESFWIERSRVTFANGMLEIQPGGYAVSDYIPLPYLEAIKSQNAGFEFPLYDSGHNLIERHTAENLAGAAYFRVFAKHGSYQNVVFKTKPDGKPWAPEQGAAHPGEIVLRYGADLRERLAATELARHVKLITGKAMPIVSEPSSRVGVKIHIGKALASAFTNDLQALAGSDGFAVRRNANNIYIFGAKPAGALYGVYAFLEANSDIIWFRPDPDFGTVFSPQAELKFATANWRSRPVFPNRWWGSGLWPGRNRANGSWLATEPLDFQQYRRKELGQALMAGNVIRHGFLFPWKYGASNPEFFVMKDGVRQPERGNVCFTSVAGREALIAEARQLLAQAPEDVTVYLSCSIDDTWDSCECPTCREPIPLPGGLQLHSSTLEPVGDQEFRSTQFYRYMNAVGEALRKDYPDIKILTLAYIFTAALPRVPLDESIVPMFAPYPTADMRFGLLGQRGAMEMSPESWGLRFERWLAECPRGNMMMFEYYFPAYFALFGEPAADNLRALAKAGGRGIISMTLADDQDKALETWGTNANMWDVNAMEQWIICRLLWDPEQDVAQLRKEFLRRTYREAAPIMAEFYRLYAEKWFDPTLARFFHCHSSGPEVIESLMIKTKIDKTLRALLKSAEAKAVHPNSRKQIAHMAAVFDAQVAELGLISVPFVDSTAQALREPNSPHWLKAVAVERFRNFDIPLNNENLFAQKTSVRLMHDKQDLFFRVEAHGKRPPGQRPLPPSNSRTAPPEAYALGERFELFFETSKGRVALAFSPDGKTSDMRNWEASFDSGWSVKCAKNLSGYVAVGRIPLASISDDGSNCKMVLIRVDPDGKEGFFSSKLVIQ